MMQKKSLLSLKIEVKRLVNKSPEFYVRLNQEELTNQDNQFIGYTSFGTNTLEVVFLNKIANDTKIDNQGNIVEDLCVIVDSLSIDNIDVSHDCKRHGIYTTQDQTVESTHGFLHKNGVFCYKFVCPIFYHLRNRNLIKNTNT